MIFSSARCHAQYC